MSSELNITSVYQPFIIPIFYPFLGRLTVYAIVINNLFTQAILVVFIVFSIGSTKIRSQYYRCRCLCRLELNQIVKILSSKSFDDFWNKIAQNSNLSTHTPSMYKVHRSTNLLKIKRIIWQLPTSFTTK